MAHTPNFDTYQVVIGLEIHVQLDTQTKLFSQVSTDFGAPANQQVDPIDLGMPGMLPVINYQAIDYAIRFGLAMGAKIHQHNVFARKHYFYPDLPKAYQISQFEDPILTDGHIRVGEQGEDASQVIDIVRAHLEEDAAKLVHLPNHTSGVDFNRSGVPLLEVVTAPQLRSPAQAAQLMRQISQIVSYLGICTGNLEEGALRCDANISLRPNEDAPLGTRTELKNINSFRFVEKALEYEIERQRDCLKEGKTIVQETRLFDSQSGQTYSMRSKEDAQDYRYFPDPDLLPVQISDEWIEKVRALMPILPAQRAEGWVRLCGLDAVMAEQLSLDRQSADYFDSVVVEMPAKSQQIAGAWIVNEIIPRLQQANLDFSACPVAAPTLRAVIDKLASGKLTTPMARQLIDLLWQGEQDVEALIKQHKLEPISGQGDIEQLVDKLLQAHPQQVDQLRAGKDKLIGFFVGLAMKETRGRIDPGSVTQCIKEKLGLN